jgi:Dolichyl-phosphate-mannose-protein mannosyltransferase
LPDPRSWSGCHPPLYAALGALAWAVTPERVPIHVPLRLLSGAAGLAAVAVIWRVLGRLVPRADAAAVGALLLGVPVIAMATSMLGNETLCMLFVTIVLARALTTPERPEAGPRHAWATAPWVLLALLSKATGLLAMAVLAANYALRYRSRPRSALACVAITGVLPVLIVAPFYVRVAASADEERPLALVLTGVSADVRAMSERQPPGERKIVDYLRLPAATFLEPNYRAEGMTRSVPGLLYASTWADAHVQFLRPLRPSILRAESGMAIAGLLPTAIAVYGLALCVRRRAGLFAPLLLGGVLVASMLRFAWIVPSYAALKASYLLAGTLPAALALAVGLEALRERWRGIVRTGFVVLSVSGSALTWYACWH